MLERGQQCRGQLGLIQPDAGAQRGLAWMIAGAGGRVLVDAGALSRFVAMPTVTSRARSAARATSPGRAAPDPGIGAAARRGSAGATANPVQRRRTGAGRQRGRLEHPNTNDTFVVGRDGTPGPALTTPSAGGGPFGFDFDRAGHLLVSDAALTTGQSGAASYDVARDGTVTANGPAVPIDQAAACWLAASPTPRTPAAARSGATPSRPMATSPRPAARWSRTTPPRTRSTRRQRRPELPVRPGRRPVADRRLPGRRRRLAHPGDHRPGRRRLRRHRRSLKPTNPRNARGRRETRITPAFHGLCGP